MEKAYLLAFLERDVRAEQARYWTWSRGSHCSGFSVLP